ncbi:MULTISPECIES: hypothetical protein [unclassified Curtobacterium]|uniref:hypothetical protein n=1 Tax=unclassified Curtobacterium TaxID=257496 RepID=UPI0008DE6CDF|nr:MULTISPECIES: hypothetical protein [unclassified Curtobacterium]OIH93009.1 hypothetical protein BIU92_09030 [Curtobacterium sp. MCBA15_003]OII29922.1 hypothetical protein BIU94_09770 [Curtobacterium sp. MMLR14_006]
MADIAAALTALLNDRDSSVDDTIGRYFADDYRQMTDGVWSDRAQFEDHITHLRGIVAHAEVRVLDELVQGTTYADRHEVHATKVDGTLVVQEVYLFATLADDGRFSEVHEVTHLLRGSEADRSMGTAS